jgi:predicted amidohydrolase
MLRVGFYQFRPLFGQVEKNLNKVVATLKQAAADIIVLPELPFTGYFFKDRAEVASLAENISDSETVATLIQLCHDRDYYVVTGFVELDGDNLYNSALLIGPAGVEHRYRKLHLFNEEKNWFDPGNLPLQTTHVRGVNIGLMVCFDWVFPEVVRSLALLGADIICHPSNLVLSFCQEAMITRCLENGIFAITANRFGTDDRPHGKLTFTGKSQIVAPKGKLLHRATSQRESLYIQEIDIRLTHDKKMTPYNHLLQDRRPEFYLGGSDYT